jgi:hypothetical protein
MMCANHELIMVTSKTPNKISKRNDVDDISTKSFRLDEIISFQRNYFVLTKSFCFDISFRVLEVTVNKVRSF